MLESDFLLLNLLLLFINFFCEIIRCHVTYSFLNIVDDPG